jgi:hypothetical protein
MKGWKKSVIAQKSQDLYKEMEILNSKHEIRNKHEFSKYKFSEQKVLDFDIWICFEFRYSDFEFFNDSI